ncbi:hypothetical protein SG34_012885 [Thalassomonas viridans]|uniref:Uncharacterized protein n=1 Tax=Thalassomonas viridans TaxID=137584 RepID=A0AAE9Z6M4_9GAMM|nr:hypothetical protein [Thalassomonas viridans]WDE07705.1 hypothetical protein SG34_012885 [Thalassomonas viridans]
MKINLLKVLGLVLCFNTFSVFAGDGKARLSHWYGENLGMRTFVYLSNISDNPVKVSVTFYGKNGAIQTQGITYYNFSNGNTELPAKSSGYIKMEPPTEDPMSRTSFRNKFACKRNLNSQ